MAGDTAAGRMHEAAQGYLRDDEVLIGWCVVLDVVGPNDRRYLGHRAGGGGDGSQSPTAWTALGMLRAATQVAEDQLRASTTGADEQ